MNRCSESIPGSPAAPPSRANTPERDLAAPSSRADTSERDSAGPAANLLEIKKKSCQPTSTPAKLRCLARTHIAAATKLRESLPTRQHISYSAVATRPRIPCTTPGNTAAPTAAENSNSDSRLTTKV
jgi:hypothetical protein